MLLAAIVADYTLAEKQGAVEEKNLEEWVCRRETKEGGECGAVFASRAPLLSHQVNLHDDKHPVTSTTVMNVCTVCESTFASIKATKQHITSAFETGHCRIERAVTQWPCMEPTHGLSCHLCEQAFDEELVTYSSARELVRHFRSHFPVPSPVPQLEPLGGVAPPRRPAPTRGR